MRVDTRLAENITLRTMKLVYSLTSRLVTLTTKPSSVLPPSYLEKTLIESSDRENICRLEMLISTCSTQSSLLSRCSSILQETCTASCTESINSTFVADYYLGQSYVRECRDNSPYSQVRCCPVLMVIRMFRVGFADTQRFHEHFPRSFQSLSLSIRRTQK